MIHQIRCSFLLLVIAFAASTVAQVIPSTEELPSDPIDTVQGTSVASEGIRDAAAGWELLDIAREEFMQGKAPAALVILEELAADTNAIDTNFLNARRELTAFVLASLGEHQRAFDTLQLFVHDRLGLIEQEGVKREEKHAGQIDDLERKVVLQEQEAKIRERDLQEQHEEYFYFSVALIVLLLLINILLAIIAARRSKTRKPIPIAAVSQEAPATEKRELQKAPIISARRIHPAEPLDPGVLLAHTEHISAQLNKGATVEAAGHLGILNRFLKIMTEEEGRSVPAQFALALFRQFLKLEVLRSNLKVKYSVDADRSLIDTGALVPAVPILHSLSFALHSAAASGAMTLNVELVPSASGNGLQCVIAHPAGPADINFHYAPFRSENELQITETIEVGEKVMRIEWILPSVP